MWPRPGTTRSSWNSTAPHRTADPHSDCGLWCRKKDEARLQQQAHPKATKFGLIEVHIVPPTDKLLGSRPHFLCPTGVVVVPRLDLFPIFAAHVAEELYKCVGIPRATRPCPQELCQIVDGGRIRGLYGGEKVQETREMIKMVREKVGNALHLLEVEKQHQTYRFFSTSVNPSKSSSPRSVTSSKSNFVMMPLPPNRHDSIATGVRCGTCMECPTPCDGDGQTIMGSPTPVHTRSRPRMVAVPVEKRSASMPIRCSIDTKRFGSGKFL